MMVDERRVLRGIVVIREEKGLVEKKLFKKEKSSREEENCY
jgi:hypothetical protein